MVSTEARKYVVEHLHRHGASLFEPLVGADDVDLAARGQDGQYVELRILDPEAGGRAFRMGRFRPKAHVFFVCVVGGEEPTDGWVFPSGIFERFADGAPGASSRVLDLDANDMGETLGDRLQVYQNRWRLIAEFSKYRSTLSDPIALQMRIAMG